MEEQTPKLTEEQIKELESFVQQQSQTPMDAGTSSAVHVRDEPQPPTAEPQPIRSSSRRPRGNRESNGTPLRTPLRLKVFVEPDVESLKTLAGRMKNIQCGFFTKKYGKIMDLLKVDVKVDALTALAQFYDPPFRCFTFQDFQLAPTLEEFGKILGFSLKNINPYQYRVHDPSLKRISQSLNIPIKQFIFIKQKNSYVLPGEYLKEQAKALADKEDWDHFREMLALLIFGFILFPNGTKSIDLAAIDVFMAFKHEGENPVPAILADTYSALDLKHENGEGLILCCSHVLYVWLMSHTTLTEHQIESITRKQWGETLVNLNEKTVHWYSRTQGIEEVICKCGDFNDVPLMGTQGCINYNPSLALRQLGYPMLKIPTMDEKDLFVIRYGQIHDTVLLRRIRKSWKKVVKKGRDLGPRSTHTNEIYLNWVRNRALEVKMPFRFTISAPPEEIIVEPFYSIEDLKSDLAKRDQKIEELQKELEKAQQAYRDLKHEKDEQSLALENVRKRAREEEEKSKKTREGLWAANTELGYRNQEKNECKKLLKLSHEKQNETRLKLEDLRQELRRVRAECENKREQSEELIDAYQTALAKKEEMNEKEGIIEETKQEMIIWKDRFSKLASLASSAIDDVPRLLRAADGMIHPLSTYPPEISDFIDHCKKLLKKMKKLIGS